MNCNELMIGDWVKLMNPNGEWLTNVQIDSNLFIPFLQYGEDGFVRFEPIPLTTKIIEKNGWKEFFYGGVDDFNQRFFRKGNDRRLQLSMINGDKCFCTNFSLGRIDFYYVHELQHALRLCGLNDLSNNFKIKGGEE